MSAWLQAGIWLMLYVLWAALSRSFHPSLRIDLLVTAILLAAYAAAVYLNHMVLIPGLLRRQRPLLFGLALLAAMNLLTALAIGVLRWVYSVSGYGAVLGAYWPNYLVDLAGMVVHVAGAAALVAGAARLPGRAC